jgi:hypothetical protein
MIVVGLKPAVPLIALGYFIFLFVLPFGSGSSRAIWQVNVEPQVRAACAQHEAWCLLPAGFPFSRASCRSGLGMLMSEGGALATTFAGQLPGAGAGAASA